MDERRIREYVDVLGSKAGEDKIFLDAFAERLLTSPEIGEEFIYYMEKRDFLCRMDIAGYTVVDIMIWQIDHFKAEMDRGRTALGDNGSRMVLYAFDTMLKMRQKPEKYKELMRTETGTDYPGKY